MLYLKLQTSYKLFKHQANLVGGVMSNFKTNLNKKIRLATFTNPGMRTAIRKIGKSLKRNTKLHIKRAKKELYRRIDSTAYTSKEKIFKDAIENIKSDGQKIEKAFLKYTGNETFKN